MEEAQGLFTEDEVFQIRVALMAGRRLKGLPLPDEEQLESAVVGCATIKRAFVALQMMLAGFFLLVEDEESVVFVPNPSRPFDTRVNPLADEIEGLLQAREWGDEMQEPPNHGE